MENVITWFEIPVKNIGRAKKFYEKVLETTLTEIEEGGYKMAAFPFDGQNVSGALVVSEDAGAPGGAMVFLNAGANLDKAIARTLEAGGKIVSEKIPIDPGVVVSIMDSEGNKVSLYAAE